MSDPTELESAMVDAYDAAMRLSRVSKEAVLAMPKDAITNEHYHLLATLDSMNFHALMLKAAKLGLVREQIPLTEEQKVRWKGGGDGS